jgi:outer membrane biosynthesis protein TonB
MKNERFIFFTLLSIVIHLLFFVAVALLKSVKFTRIPPQENVVFMHVMPLGKINNIKTRNQKQSDAPEKEEAKKVEKQEDAKLPEPIKSPEQNKPEEPKPVPKEAVTPKTEPVPEPAKPEVKEVKPEKIEQPAKPEPKKEAKTQDAAQKKKDDKPKKKSDDLDLNKLMQSLEDKNKEKASVGKLDKSNKKSGGSGQDKQTSSSDNYDQNSPESLTAKTLLQKRIESNWGRPPSMRDYESLRVKVKLKIDINQNIQEISGFEFLNEAVPEHVKNAIKESIIRAIQLSEPFDMLSLEHYDYWNNNT